MTRHLLLLSMLLMCASCAHPQKTHALKQAQQTQFVKDVCRQYTNVIMFVEGTDPIGTLLYVGTDQGTHTCRHAALLVRFDGTVWKQITRPDQTLGWTPIE